MTLKPTSTHKFRVKITSEHHSPAQTLIHTFDFNYVDECVGDELKRNKNPATSHTYTIKAAGSTATWSSWYSEIGPKSLTRCYKSFLAYVDMEISGQWVAIWTWVVDGNTATDGTDKPAWLTVEKATITNKVRVKLKVQTDDASQFATKLVTPQTFNLRVRVIDKYSSHSTNELIDPLALTFAYDCSASKLSASTAISKPAVTFNVKATGSTAAVTDTTTVTQDVSNCQA